MSEQQLSSPPFNQPPRLTIFPLSIPQQTSRSKIELPGMSSSHRERTMESRTGRSKQRYNSKGERLVAGVVPLTEDKHYVLLIQSTRRKGWVLPKGGWETDEECTEAAAREAWEEAGISIEIKYDLGDIVETRPPKHSGKESSKSLYRFFEATVLQQEENWPEMNKRERRWMTYAEATEALAARPELLEALSRCTMAKS